MRRLGLRCSTALMVLVAVSLIPLSSAVSGQAVVARLTGPNVVRAQNEKPMLNETVEIIQGTWTEEGACMFGFGGGGNIGDSGPPLTYRITAVDEATCQAELHVGVREFRPAVSGADYLEDNEEEQYFPNPDVTCASIPEEERALEPEPCQDVMANHKRSMVPFAAPDPGRPDTRENETHYNQQLTVNATTEDPVGIVTNSVRVRIKTNTSGNQIIGVSCASGSSWLTQSGWERDASWSDISGCPLSGGTAIKYRSEHYYNPIFCLGNTTHAWYLDISAQLTLTTWNFWATGLWTSGSCTSLLDQFLTPYPGEWW